MKSKLLKRGIAIMLCMVIMFSGSEYLHAESPEEEVATVPEETLEEEEAEVLEETPEEEEAQVLAEVPEEVLEEPAVWATRTVNGEVIQKLPEKLSVEGTANEWQIVSGRYEADKAQTVPTADGLFRIQKNVIPAGIENEFYVYLNIEPQMEWSTETFLKRATIWIANSASVKEGTGTGLSEASTASEVKSEVNGSGEVAKLSDS